MHPAIAQSPRFPQTSSAMNTLASHPIGPEGRPMDPARLVQAIVQGLVDKPACVRAQKRLTPQRVTIVVHVAPSDMSLVIGRKGRTATAIRCLLTRFRNLDKRKYRLTFREAQSALF